MTAPRWLPMAAFSAAALVSFGMTLRDAARYSGIDLRARVVSTRAFFSGLEAYEVPWSPGTSEALLDPLRRHPGPGRSLNAPTLFFVYRPTAWLAYPVQRWLWFGLDWLLFLAGAWLLTRTVAPPGRAYFVAVVLVSFLISHSWRLHVERGQSYSLLVLLLSLALHAEARRTTARGEAAGAWLGIAAALRPSLFVIPAVLWMLGRRRTAATSVGVGLLLSLATLPAGGAASWRSAMRTIDNFRWAEADDGFVERSYPRAYVTPSVAEGLDLVSCLDTTAWEPTFFRLALFSRKLANLPTQTLLALERLMGVLGPSSLLALVAGGALRPNARAAPMLVASTVALDAELFLPSKCAYAELLQLPALALAVPLLAGRALRLYGAVLLVLGALSAPAVAGAADLAILRSLLSLGLLNALVFAPAARPRAAGAAAPSP